jgi:hypothetical protein
VKEQVQANEVHVVRLGEGEGASNKASQALTNGQVKAFDVIGETRGLADSLMIIIGNDGPVGVPEVCKADALLEEGGNGVPKLPTGGDASSADDAGDNLLSLPA